MHISHSVIVNKERRREENNKQQEIENLFANTKSKMMNNNNKYFVCFCFYHFCNRILFHIETILFAYTDSHRTYTHTAYRIHI